MLEGRSRRPTVKQEAPMVRSFAYLALFLLVGMPLRAGELDEEFGGKAPDVSLATPKVDDSAGLGAATPSSHDLVLPTDLARGSELDGEVPTQLWGHHGWGRGFGWGGGWGGGFGGW